MNEERADLIREIRNQDKKLQLIAKPFGAYINIIDIDDVHFEDKFLSTDIKQKLAVTQFEEALSLKFNLVVSSMGFRDTQWGRLAIIMFAVWCLCTCFVCFQKADFLNVSLVSISSFELSVARFQISNSASGVICFSKEIRFDLLRFSFFSSIEHNSDFCFL